MHLKTGSIQDCAIMVTNMQGYSQITDARISKLGYIEFISDVSFFILKEN